MKQQSKESVLVMANAITLTTGIVGRLTGGPVADTIGGTPVRQETMMDLVVSHVQNRLHREAVFLNKN